MMSWCNNTAVTMSTKSVSFKESEFVKRRIYVIKQLMNMENNKHF